jgi:hypothetical protein
MILDLTSQVVHLDWEAASETLEQIIDRGWYMPGLPFIIAMAAMFTDSFALLRLYMGILNFALLASILKLLHDAFGLRTQLVFLSIVLMVPYYAIYTFLLWGDLLAAQLLLLLGLIMIREVQGCEGQGLSPRAGALLGLSIVLITYVRGAYWLCLPLGLVGIFLSSHALAPISARLRHLFLTGGSCVLIFFLLLAPWSFAVSQQYGPYLTTTSMAMSQIIVFGSEDYLASAGDASESNIYFRMHQHIVDLALASGASYADQASEELRKATVDLTTRDYLLRVEAGFKTFLLDSETFIERFRVYSSLSEAAPSVEVRERVFDWASTLNHWSWRAMLFIGLLLFVAPVELSRRSLMQSLVFKFAIFFFSLQPFFVVAHGRYYVQYIPFFAMAMALSVSRERFWVPGQRPSSLDERLVFAGQMFALALGGAALAVFALALAR